MILMYLVAFYYILVSRVLMVVSGQWKPKKISFAVATSFGSKHFWRGILDPGSLALQTSDGSSEFYGQRIKITPFTLNKAMLCYTLIFEVQLKGT